MSLQPYEADIVIFVLLVRKLRLNAVQQTEEA